jgi:hypothetical protein
MPKDIESYILVKDSGKDKGSPKPDKPPSPSAAKNYLEVVKPLSPRNVKDATEGAKSSCPNAIEGTRKAMKPPCVVSNEETPRTNQGNN